MYQADQQPYLVFLPDWRDTSYSPNTYSGNRVGWHFNNISQNGGPAGDFWGAMQTVAPWSEFNTSHRQMQLWWGGSSGLSYRYAVGSGYTPTGWSGWERIMTSSNAAYAWNMNQYVRTSDDVSFSVVRGGDVYTTGGWFRNHTNNNGIYWSGTGWHLYPKNSEDFYMRSGASDASIHFLVSGGTARNYIHNASDNAIGFLSTGRSWILRVDNSGNTTATGDVTAYSDARLKENIIPITNALEKVGKINGVYYNRIDTEDKSTKIGFIAQDVKEIVPEVVSIQADLLAGINDRHSIDYGKFTALLVEAIKELNAKIVYLESQLASK